METLTLIGTLLGAGAVIGGALLEGLHLSAILQPTAALIVMGGTLAAVLVSYPRDDVMRALKDVPWVFRAHSVDLRRTIEEIITVASVARKDGVLAIEPIRESITDPLFKKAIKFVIDGFEPQTVKDILEAEITLTQEEEEISGRVWESAGGYSPTIGILGAVLGLIHVMENLDDPSRIGSGIAVAFVATVYGVAAANLVFLPWGSKLKRQAQLRALSKEIVRLGVIGIQEGLNPNFLREKLEVYVGEKKAS